MLIIKSNRIKLKFTIILQGQYKEIKDEREDAWFFTRWWLKNHLFTYLCRGFIFKIAFANLLVRYKDTKGNFKPIRTNIHKKDSTKCAYKGNRNSYVCLHFSFVWKVFWTKKLPMAACVMLFPMLHINFHAKTLHAFYG